MRFCRTLLVVTATGILALVVSCRDIVAPPPVAAVSLSDYSADLVPSETVLITATPKDAGGIALTRPIIWTTSAASVATVENGLITGHDLGSAIISATSEGVKADVAVTVDDGGIITPAGNLISGLGGTVALEFPSASVTQSSRITISQPIIAAANTRLIPGSAVSLRTDAPLTQPALLTIRYNPDRILGSPEAGLRLYEATPNNWKPVERSAVDVNTRTVRGGIVRSGVYGIFAQARVASVSVAPTSPGFKVGDAPTFTALLRDEDGATLTGRPLTWSSSAADVVEIDATSGAAKAKSPGSATVTATAEGQSGSTIVSVTTGPAANIAVVAGSGQIADTSRAVSTPPSVKVTDRAGFAVAGAPVTFTVTTGGGTVSPTSASTDASGVATAERWTLGSIAGANSVTASIANGASVVFNATATQPPPPLRSAPPPPPAPATPPAPVLVPAIISIFAGDGQTAVPLTAVAINPAAKVTTATGIPVPGVTVTFSIRSGGGSVTGESAKTDSLGIATVGKWVLGSGGGNSLFATAAGLSGSPLIFVATASNLPPPSGAPPSSPPPPASPPATSGPPVAMAIYAGDGQNAPAMAAVPVPPSVKITDLNGAGVPGVVVTFSIRSGGGSLSGETATSNAQGIATVGQWTLGPPGGNSIYATSPGLSGSPLVFVAMATGGIRVVTFGDSNTDAGYSGTNPAFVSVSYISSDGSRMSPSAPNNPTQLAGKIEAKWYATTGSSITAVNHGVSGTRTGAGRTSLNAPNAREQVNGITRFQAEVLGAGYPWNGGETGTPYPNGALVRSKAFVPGTKDFAYISMGTNDFVGGGLSPDQSAANLSWMIDQWVSAGKRADHLIITTLPPRANSAGNIPPLNDRIRSLAAARGVGLVDISSRTSNDNGATWRSPLDHVGDSIHYSEAVRDWIAAQVVTYLQALQ